MGSRPLKGGNRIFIFLNFASGVMVSVSENHLAVIMKLLVGSGVSTNCFPVKWEAIVTPLLA